MSTFGERLKKFREDKGYDSQGKFAKKVKIHPSTISSYETADVSPGTDKLQLIKEAFPNDDIEYLATGIRKDKKYAIDQNSTANIHEPASVYSINRNVSGKTTLVSHEIPRKLPALTMNKLARITTKEDLEALLNVSIVESDPYAVLPEYNYCNLYVEVEGDAMNPTYGPFEKVGVKIKTDTTFIEAGRTYIINVLGDLVIRRVFETEDKNQVILKADNKNYPDQIIERKWIVYMLSVHAVTKGHTFNLEAA